MRSIEFIAPVESMRGNLSGRQDLVYNDHDNKAFEAPVGRQYAKNYQPRFIGAKRASDNRKYFAVKTKSATRITDVTKLNMALLGASAVIYNIINRLEQYGTTEQKINIDIIRQEWMSMEGVTYEAGTSWKMFLMERIRVMLSTRSPYAEFGSTLKTKVLNPYYYGPAPTPASENLVIDLPEYLLIKFWVELAVRSAGGAPIIFTVNGLKGIAFSTMTFQQLIDSQINILNIRSVEPEGAQDVYAFIGADPNLNWLKDSTDSYVLAQAVVSPGKYTTTTVTPA